LTGKKSGKDDNLCSFISPCYQGKGELIMAVKELLEGKRVLIVDDEPDVLETLVDLLPNYNRLAF
jgi:transcription antitermination factor NusA-like protein